MVLASHALTMLERTSLLATEQAPQAWGTQLDQLAFKLTEASSELAATVGNVEAAFKSLSPGMADATKANVTEAGAKFTDKLLIYSEQLHPIACETLLNLESFLEPFEDLSYTQFLQMLPQLVKEVPAYAYQAYVNKALHEAYVVELDALLSDAQRSLRKLELEAQAQEQRAYRKEKSSRILQTRGFELVCCLLGPAGTYMAKKGEEKRQRAVDCYDQATALGTLSDQLQLGLPQAIRSMQGVGRIVADFFDCLEAELGKMSKRGVRLEAAHEAGAADSVLQTLHQGVNTRLQDVMRACNTYRATGQPLRIAVRSIARVSQPEEWVQGMLAAVQLEASRSGRCMRSDVTTLNGSMSALPLC